MAKSGKGSKQARKLKENPKPQVAGETAASQPAGATVDEKTAQQSQAVGKDGGADAASVSAADVQAVAVEAPKRSFSLARYFQSGTWIYPLLLVVFMAVMAYIRIVPLYGSVFTNWDGGYVNVAADDAVMQMHIAQNTLAHFPNVISFDPFTHFPFGSPNHFGPWFTLIIASAALIVGLGNPSPQLVATVGAYIPVLLGVLCVLPVYFMGKKLFGRNGAIIAVATLALLPGQFLARSVLGFTDNHVAETLFSVATVAILVYALDAASKSGLSLEKLKSRDSAAWKALLLAAIAGFAYGVYMLNWVGALLVGFMLFAYFVIQAIVDHLSDRPLDYLVIVAAMLFIVPAVMVLPYSLQDTSLDLMYYSLTQPVFLCIATVSMVGIYAVSRVLKDSKAASWAFPATLAGIAVVGLLVTYLVFPQLYALAMAGFNVFVPRGGMLTVAEASPTIYSIGTGGALTINLDTIAGGNGTTGLFWGSFYWTIVASVIALFLLLYQVLKNRRPAELLFLIWNVIMLWAACSQIRFTYYFAVNAALLTGYLAYAAFKWNGWEKYVGQFREKVRTPDDIGAFLNKHIFDTLIFAVLGIVFVLVVIYPVTSMSLPTGVSSTYTSSFFGGMTMYQASMGGPGMNYDWYSALTWLRDNTPNPQGSPVQSSFDYNGTYSTDTYPNGTWIGYPASAYGVMSWWDYGHDIEYVGQRIPNANQYQAGILENNNTDGSSPFFLATSESDAYRNLQDLGTKYVMIDFEMATSKFYAITVWDNKDYSQYYSLENVPVSSTVSLPLMISSSVYNSTMMSQLYYSDCNDMSHFRLVYQSPGEYIDYGKIGLLDQYSSSSSYGYVPFIENWNQYGLQYPMYTNYSDAYQIYNASHTSLLPLTQGSLAEFMYDGQPPVKYVKTYQVVAGATITGSAPANSTVTASLGLHIEDRDFTYTQTATADANGAYTMTVPYASTAMNGTGYTSQVTPLTSTYTITNSADNTTKTVAVPEHTVINGETVTVQ